MRPEGERDTAGAPACDGEGRQGLLSDGVRRPGTRQAHAGQRGGAAHAALVAAVTLLTGVCLLVALAVSLPLAFQEETSAAPPPAARPATRAEAQVALDEAVAALLAADEEAWRAALPASGAGRRATSELFGKLGGLPWSALSATLDPVPSKPGRFDVRLLGALAGAGPDDRVVAERVLGFELRGDRVVVSDDATPAAVRPQYVMAYRDPEVVANEACVVLSEAKDRGLAASLAAAARDARADLAVLGIDPQRPVMLYLYARRDQLRRALGGGPGDRRFEFFSAAVPRRSPELWWPRDVHILGPALEGRGSWLPRLLAHELTHAFTVHWFAATRNDPMFLAEGLAVAVEGGRSYAPLREELAAGNTVLPLKTAIALGSLWSGNPDDKVQLAYLEAGSVVLYVLDGWGLAGLRRWLTAVADSDLTPKGIEQAVAASLGVTWDEFVAGWTDYVETLP